MKKLGAICLFVLAGTTQAGDRLSTVDVYGLQVPGTPALAKEAGFTDCKDNYSNYACKRTKPTVVAGVKAESADLFFDGSDHFSETNSGSNTRKVSEFPPEKLTYGGVRLQFQDRQALKQALLADGWMESTHGNSTEFYKEGVAANFSIYRSTVSLDPLSLKEATKQVANLKAKQVEKAKTDSNSTSFIDAMKK